MKKISLLAVLSVLLFAANCSSTKGLQDTSLGDKVTDSVDSMEDGFIGEDKLIVKGDGSSPAQAAGLTNLQKEATAKEAARMDAQRKVIEVCRGANVQAAATVDNFALAGSAVGKDLAGRMKGAKVKKSTCGKDGDRMSCKVLMEVEKKGLKKDCELAMGDLAK